MIVKNPEKNHLKNSLLIKYIEDFLNVKLPIDYKNFLLETNGGDPINIYFIVKLNGELGSIQYFFGDRPESYARMQSKLDTYSGKSIHNKRIPNNMIAIASDPGGDLILLSVSGPDYGKIYYWDHNWEAEEGETPDYSNLTLIADSFDEFISMLKSEEEIDALESSNKATVCGLDP